MLKGKNTSLFTKTLTIISFIVLYSFLLTSYSASAVGSWSSSTSSYGRFYYDVYGGCLWDTYSLKGDGTNTSSVFLGTNKVGSTSSSSDLYNCGYRYLNSKMDYYSHSISIKRELVLTDGEATTDSFSTVGGSTNLVTSYNAGFADYNFDIYNDVESMQFKFSNSTSPFSLPALPEGVDNGYAFYLLSFDIPSLVAPLTADFTGLQFGIASTSSLTIPSGSEYSFASARSYMNDSIITWCGDIDAYSRAFPEELTSLSITTKEGFSKCFVGGSVPLGSIADAIKFSNGNTIVLEAKDGSTYSKNHYTTSSGKILTYYGYPWRGVFRSPSYKAMSSRYNDSLKFYNPRFDIVWCVDDTECADFTDKNNALMTDSASSVGSTNSFGGYSSTVQEEIDYNQQQINSATSALSGLNINFSVPWVLQAWFNLFIDSDCVSIPNLSSMLHSEETQVCSPWRGTNIRSILTPIVTGVFSLLLFGFVVRWLKHGSTREFDNG